MFLESTNFKKKKKKDQLNTLVQTLTQTGPHFIRCIKPNNLKKEEIFDDDLVMKQLNYLGLLQAVKIRKAGFPIRKPFSVFYRE